MVDKNSITPLYEQVANDLRREIVAGRFGDSGSIGTHEQLTKRFGVSMITVRKALQTLEKEGMVDVQQGKGTFVHCRTMVNPLRDLTPVSQLMSDLNLRTDVRVPILEITKTPSWLPRDVRTLLGPECLFIQRVVDVEQRPFANVEMYLPLKYADHFSKSGVEQRTVYQIYEQDVGVKLGKGKQIIRANMAQGRVAECLGIPKNWPVLQIERKTYSRQEELIEYMIVSYEAGSYSFAVEIEMTAGTGAIM